MNISNGLNFSQASIEKTNDTDKANLKAEHAAKKKITPNYRQELGSVVSITNKHPNIQSRAQSYVSIALKNPKVKEKFQQLQNLKEKYSNCAKTIENSSWKKLCQERGLGMTKPHNDEEISLEEFRTLMNAAIDEVAIAIGKESDCPEASFGACGTVAYNSDVDTAILGKNLSPIDANIYTTARNEIHTAILGGHSGPQFDTEAYIPHPAQYNTAGSLSRNPEAHARYVMCEKSNVALQYYASLMAHPEEYQTAKEDYLNKIEDPEHRQGMAEVFKQSEALMDHLEGKISKEILLQNGFSGEDIEKMNQNEITRSAANIRHEKPEAYKAARENVAPQIRGQLGIEIDKIDKKIETLQKQLTSHFKMGDTSNVRNLKTLDDLHNHRNEMLSIMNILQDEGTNSQSEGKVTLFQEKGQIYAGAQKKAIKKLSDNDKQQTGVVGFLLNKGGGIVADYLYKDQLRTNLAPKGFEKPNAETLSIAADEESAQRIHTFNDAMRKIDKNAPPRERDEMAMKAIGHSKQAKYAERTTSNTYRALNTKIEELKQKGETAPKDLIILKNQAKKLMDKSTNLLRCMRRDFLGAEATEHLLEVAFGKERSGSTAFDPILVKAQIRKVVDLFEPGGREDGKPLEKHEKMNIMIKDMINLGLLNSQNVTEKEVKNPETGHINIHLIPSNPEIKKILEARVGHSIESPEHEDLIPLHDAALFFTCKRLGLDSETAVTKFNSQVIDINVQRENLFVKKGWIPKVTTENAKKLNFLEILSL